LTMEKQKTIGGEVSLSGIGLHMGNKVNIKFKPAGVDSGINFIRTDFGSKEGVLAVVDNLLPISRSPRRTSIGKGEIEIHTVEHLMAVLLGLSIDNIAIEIDNNEVPGFDGSGLTFLEALKQAGIVEQEKQRDCYQIKETISVEENGSSIVAIPSSEFRVSYTLRYDHPQINAQFIDLNITPETFEKEVAKSRTFCLEDEASDLQSQGLGQGANYENTLVVGKNGVIQNRLRYNDEYARHKILDLIGDLYLLGSPVKAHIVAIRSGHSLNIKLLRKIIEQKTRFLLGGVGSCGECLPKEGELDVEEIKKILPHRYPFLFVDRILYLDKGKRAVGLKNVTKDDYYFKGHFPGKPVMPGVLIIEAMAQVGGVMMLSLEQNRGKLAYFLAANNVKFRKTVVPGDKLILEVDVGKLKSKTGLVYSKALVDGKVVAEAELMFAVADN